ncbi:hypothetical protein BGW36DRAFT_429537 [Talaromyces proteolyticus]|uniref:Uncharacterized protein n=1 Tax=Talaromyces proteolyticus TaxID=1131652 RepID=A0AAD4KSP6_9EURO|nr:uncharacterized protein BGW36DRAFT_429537 [Talaromyces proteolyticus]KAH8695672.1 hypothetical protein BGW36DRAFT_429537 [Talaromyces proteolyticus]
MDRFKIIFEAGQYRETLKILERDSDALMHGAIIHCRQFFVLLRQLDSARREKCLNEARNAGSDAPLFDFRSLDDPQYRTNDLSRGASLHQDAVIADSNSFQIANPGIQEPEELGEISMDMTSGCDTIDPCLLQRMGDWDDMLDDGWLASYDSSGLPLDPLTSGAENNLGLTAIMDDPAAPLESFIEQLPVPVDVENLLGKDLGRNQADDGSNQFMGLPTPPSDSPSPAAQSQDETGHRRKSKKQRVTKSRSANSKRSSPSQTSLASDDQVLQGLARSPLATVEHVTRNPTPETDDDIQMNLPIPSHTVSRSPTMEMALAEISSDNLETARQRCEPFLHDNLVYFLEETCQGFWDRPAVTLDLSHESIRGEAHAKVFRYVNDIEKPDNKKSVRIRFGQVLLYLLYIKELHETIKRRELGVGKGGKTKTEAIDNIIQGIYAARLAKDETEKSIRDSFHVHKRIGERWWWLTCFTGLGILLGCGSKFGSMVKNHNFPIDAIVVCLLHYRAGDLDLCHRFDDAAKSLLTRGTLPADFHRQEVQSWIDQPTEIAGATVDVSHWSKFDHDLAEEKAQNFLNQLKEDCCNLPMWCV